MNFWKSIALLVPLLPSSASYAERSYPLQDLAPNTENCFNPTWDFRPETIRRAQVDFVANSRTDIVESLQESTVFYNELYQLHSHQKVYLTGDSAWGHPNGMSSNPQIEMVELRVACRLLPITVWIPIESVDDTLYIPDESDRD